MAAVGLGLDSVDAVRSSAMKIRIHLERCSDFWGWTLKAAFAIAWHIAAKENQYAAVGG
jgi:hypothetical protein